MSTIRANLTAELSAPGICVQVLDYRWAAGETLHELWEDHVLSYRAFPRKVTVSAFTDTSRLDFGKLFFFPAGVQVGTDAAERGELVRTVRCHFEPNWFSRIWESSSMNWDDTTLARCFDMHSSRIEQAVQRMGSEAICPGFASPLMVESLSNMIVIEMARYFRQPQDSFRMQIRGGKMSNHNIQRIYEYVLSMENECPSMGDIANACNISASHLRRTFKNSTGRTVHDYVTDVRLGKVKSLLTETDLPLKEVAYRVGFASLSTLSSSFKKQTGETPGEFRYLRRH